MSINCIALGKRICFYRLKFNITQEKLAALTNCSREYIAYLESGTKTPSLPTLIDLANVLHEIARYEEAVQFLKRNSTNGTIPTMKNLRAEKEKLLSARTAQYESYIYFKDYYHELQTACRNVDMILETEHTQQHNRTQLKRSHEPSL